MVIFCSRRISLFDKIMYWKKLYQFLIFVSLSVPNFAAGWPTIFELSSKEKGCLQSRRAEYSGN